MSIFVFLFQKTNPVKITEVLAVKNWLRVRYKIYPNYSESSYITNLIVSLNEKEGQHISDGGKRNFFSLRLKPDTQCRSEINTQDGRLHHKCENNETEAANLLFFLQLENNTQYTFGIKTQDGSLQNSSTVTGKFKIAEAGISARKYKIIKSLMLA